jgi:putative DNA primase/helicase
MSNYYIPEELQELPQWLCWTSNRIPINPTKIKYPYAKVNDPNTWGTYDEAFWAYNDRDLLGIGFVFTEDDPYVGIDIDKCRNPLDGTLTKESMMIIRLLNSYTEVSPSGTGLHVIVKSLLPFRGKQGDEFEIYHHGRFFTMTGHHYSPTPLKIQQRDDQVFQLIDKYFPDEMIGVKDKRIYELAKKNFRNIGIMKSLWKNLD